MNTKKLEESKVTYLITGSLVTLISVILNFITNSYKFAIFILAGIGLCFYGVMKAKHVRPMTKAAKHVHYKVHNHIQNQMKKTNNYTRNLMNYGPEHAKANQQKRASPYFFCPFCGNRIPPNSTFCPSCGTKLIQAISSNQYRIFLESFIKRN